MGGGDVATVFQADLAFHETLVGAAPNSRLQEVFERYVPTLRALLRLDEHVYRSLDDIALEHRPLVEAIEAGDADVAAALAEAHCDHAGELIADYVERAAEAADTPVSELSTVDDLPAIAIGSAGRQTGRPAVGGGGRDDATGPS